MFCCMWRGSLKFPAFQRHVCCQPPRHYAWESYEEDGEVHVETGEPWTLSMFGCISQDWQVASLLFTKRKHIELQRNLRCAVVVAYGPEGAGITLFVPPRCTIRFDLDVGIPFDVHINDVGIVGFTSSSHFHLRDLGRLHCPMWYGYGGCCDVWPIIQLFFLCSWTVALCWPLFLDVSFAKVHWGYTWICPTGITHLCQADPATRIHCFRKVNHLVTNQNYKSDTIFLCQVWLPEGGYGRVKIRSHQIKSQVWSLKPSAVEIWYCPIALWPPWSRTQQLSSKDSLYPEHGGCWQTARFGAFVRAERC